MSIIASLNVNLGVGIAQFSKGIMRARKEANSLLAPLVSLKAAAVGALGAVGVGVSATAFGSFVKDSMDAIDAANDAAQRIGVTTEALTSLRFAGKMGGVEMELMDASLAKMVKTLGQAALGADEPAEALKALGLEAKALANLEPEKAFSAIADGISKIENPAERAAHVTKLFGKSGQALLPVLMQGSKGLREMQQRARELGAVIDSVDAMQVAAANDALDEMFISIRGVGNQLAINLAPFIEAIAERFTAAGAQSDSWADATGDAVKRVTSFFIVLLDVIDSIPIHFKMAQIGMDQIVASTADGLGWLAEKADNLGHDLDRAWQTADQLGVWALSGGTDTRAKERAAEAWAAVGNGSPNDVTQSPAAFAQAFADEMRGVQEQHFKELNDRLVEQGNGERLRALFEDIAARSRDAAEMAVKDLPQFQQIDMSAAKKKGDKPDLGGAAEQGSAAAVSAISRAVFGDQVKRDQAATAANTKKAADLGQQQLKELQKLNAKMPELQGAGLF